MKIRLNFIFRGYSEVILVVLSFPSMQSSPRLQIPQGMQLLVAVDLATTPGYETATCEELGLHLYLYYFESN